MDAPSTPATSVAPSFHMPASPGPQDTKLVAQVQEQAKQLQEQDAMIKTLEKQLTHCESDLQAHMDMVATLETSLADAEKNCECLCYLNDSKLSRRRRVANAGRTASARTSSVEAAFSTPTTLSRARRVLYGVQQCCASYTALRQCKTALWVLE